MTKWYVIQVFSSQEKKVKKQLEDKILAEEMGERIQEVLLPVEMVVEVKEGQQRLIEKRLWPGYLLVKMVFDDDSWILVKSVPGVIDFLGGGVPQALSDNEVQQLLTDLQGKVAMAKPRHSFELGDRVKINHGVFASFEGFIERVDMERGRLTVAVSIFGRETKVDDLEFWQVEEIASENL